MSSQLNKIISVLAEYSTQTAQEINLDDELVNLDIDSLSLVEIIFDLEEMFDIKIPDEADLNEMGLPMTHVRNIETLIERLVAEKDG